MNNMTKLILIVMLSCMGVAYAQNPAPLIPTIYAKADSGKIIINWTSEAINTVDEVTGYRDFEGFRIYKSIDGGETWGGPDDQIYFNGEAKGWVPLVQFDLTIEEDSLFCLKTIDCDIEADPTRGIRISGIDPLAPWVNLGENTGLEYTYTDNDVYNGKEYTYAVVSYDIGLRSYELRYEPVANNMGVCTAVDNSENMLVEEDCCLQNGGAWDSELERCAYGNDLVCDDYSGDHDSGCNQDGVEVGDPCISQVVNLVCNDFSGLNDDDCLDQVAGDLCNVNLVCNDFSGLNDDDCLDQVAGDLCNVNLICNDFSGLNDDDCLDQVAEDFCNDGNNKCVTDNEDSQCVNENEDSQCVGVFSSGLICSNDVSSNAADCIDQQEGDLCNNGNNTCIVPEFVCESVFINCKWEQLFDEVQDWDVTNPDHFADMDGNGYASVECAISEINTVTAIPGFYAENVENISFEGIENAECIPGPNGCSVILQAENQTVGNGLKSFTIVNQDDLTESVYRFEIQATELPFENQTLTGNDFEGYKTRNPSLYVYEINNSTSKEPVNFHIYEMVEAEFADIISDLSIDQPIMCNPFAGPFYNIESCKDTLAVQLLDLPGVVYSDDIGYEIPDYIFENFQIKFIDDLGYSSNFTDFIDGLKFRFDNSLRSYPSSGNASVNSIKYISGISIDSGSPDTLEIENNDFFSVELNYGENGNAFNKRPPYSYKIKFKETPQFPVFGTAPPSVCIEAGNPGNTLLPFEVYNLTTGALVEVLHTDRGSQYQEDDDNCIDDCGDEKWCNNGECQYLKGYKDCYWQKNENIAFKYDPVNTTETITNAVNSCGDSCSDLQWCKDDVCVDLAEYTFDLKIIFETYGYGYSAAPYDSSLTYSTGSYVRRSAMLWEATSSITPNIEPTSWIDSNDDGSNDNPWKPIYNWEDGDELIIEPTSWYVDGDAWIADFSQIGRRTDIDVEDLSKISVVPNPYFSHSRFDETANSRLMWFTHLPTYCYISIYTVSGELVTSFEHNDEFSGQESWDLRSGNGDEVAPGLYIYTVESGNGSSYNEFQHIGKFAIVR